MFEIIGTRNISQTAKLAHRLIKFRYGPQRNQQSSAGSQPAATGPSKTSPKGAEEAIWDFQIPTRWKRAPLSEEECAIINNGGPL